MELRCVVAMEKGPRPDQEDCLLLGDRVFQDDTVHDAVTVSADRFLVAACDGMGGLAGGELASRFVCDALSSWDAPPTSPRALRGALDSVQHRSRASLSGNCGTTIAGGLFSDTHVLVFNVGDSRVYRWREKNITRLSHDHSVVQELIDCRMITDEEAFSHPHRNLITAGMGPAFLDIWAPRSIFSRKYRLRPKDRYLICTDGVCDVLMDRRIGELMGEDDTPACDHFWDALHDAGLRDNTGFVLVQVD